jgi:hypothetical protein
MNLFLTGFAGLKAEMQGDDPGGERRHECRWVFCGAV